MSRQSKAREAFCEELAKSFLAGNISQAQVNALIDEYAVQYSNARMRRNVNIAAGLALLAALFSLVSLTINVVLR